jgi:hypothetical protein
LGWLLDAMMWLRAVPACKAEVIIKLGRLYVSGLQIRASKTGVIIKLGRLYASGDFVLR